MLVKVQVGVQSGVGSEMSLVIMLTSRYENWTKGRAEASAESNEEQMRKQTRFVR